MTRTPRTPRARIAADSQTVVAAAALLTVVVGIAAFCVSWSGLVAMAAFAGIPEHLRACVPVLVDGALLAQTAVLLVQQERQESTRTTYAGIGAYTALSVLTNASHAVEAGGGAGGYRLAIGIALSAAAPLGVLVATHALASVAISPAPTARRAPVAAVVLTPVTTTPAVSLTSIPAPAPAPRRAVTARPAPTTVLSPAASSDARAQALALLAGGLSHRAVAAATGLSKSGVSRLAQAVAAM